MAKKTIIFDLDGTLLYTLEDLMNSSNYVMEKMGYPLHDYNEYRYFIGKGIPVLLKKAAPEGTDDMSLKKCLDLFMPYYNKHMFDTTRPYDGIMDALNAAKFSGCRTAIVSNKADSAVKELSKLFFPAEIDLALGAPLSAKKPDPYSVFQAINALGSTVGDSIYVGDTDIDIKTAHNAGLLCIGCSWGFRDRKFLEDHGSDYIIDTPSSLLPLINSID